MTDGRAQRKLHGTAVTCCLKAMTHVAYMSGPEGRRYIMKVENVIPYYSTLYNENCVMSFGYDENGDTCFHAVAKEAQSGEIIAKISFIFTEVNESVCLFACSEGRLLLISKQGCLQIVEVNIC